MSENVRGASTPTAVGGESALHDSVSDIKKSWLDALQGLFPADLVEEYATSLSNQCVSVSMASTLTDAQLAEMKVRIGDWKNVLAAATTAASSNKISASVDVDGCSSMNGRISSVVLDIKSACFAEGSVTFEFYTSYNEDGTPRSNKTKRWTTFKTERGVQTVVAAPALVRGPGRPYFFHIKGNLKEPDERTDTNTFNVVKAVNKVALARAAYVEAFAKQKRSETSEFASVLLHVSWSEINKALSAALDAVAALHGGDARNIKDFTAAVEKATKCAERGKRLAERVSSGDIGYGDVTLCDGLTLLCDAARKHAVALVKQFETENASHDRLLTLHGLLDDEILMHQISTDEVWAALASTAMKPQTTTNACVASVVRSMLQTVAHMYEWWDFFEKHNIDCFSSFQLAVKLAKSGVTVSTSGVLTDKDLDTIGVEVGYRRTVRLASKSPALERNPTPWELRMICQSPSKDKSGEAASKKQLRWDEREYVETSQCTSAEMFEELKQKIVNYIADVEEVDPDAFVDWAMKVRDGERLVADCHHLMDSAPPTVDLPAMTPLERSIAKLKLLKDNYIAVQSCRNATFTGLFVGTTLASLSMQLIGYWIARNNTPTESFEWGATHIIVTGILVPLVTVALCASFLSRFTTTAWRTPFLVQPGTREGTDPLSVPSLGEMGGRKHSVSAVAVV